MSASGLYTINPADLVQARRLCHAACQWPSRAARANLAEKDDDSHSSLSWQSIHRALASHWLTIDGREQLGFCFANRSLVWLVDGHLVDTFSLDGLTESEVGRWVDARLQEAGLKAASDIVLPYSLDELTDYSGFAPLAAHATVLGLWYEQAQTALEALIRTFQSVAVGPPSIRCWPHHFDLAVLLVLEQGDPETARSIGVGLSPGDESYAQPYFYCTPWPPPQVSMLSSPNRPLFWHTVDFTALICRAEDLNEGANIDLILVYAATLAQQVLQQA